MKIDSGPLLAAVQGMKLSLPLAVVLALLANLVPTFGKASPEVSPGKTSGELPPAQL